MTKIKAFVVAAAGVLALTGVQLSTAEAHSPRALYSSSVGLPTGEYTSYHALDADHELTTGSIVASSSLDWAAKGSNAEQPERTVPQFGTTSGGTAY